MLEVFKEWYQSVFEVFGVFDLINTVQQMNSQICSISERIIYLNTKLKTDLIFFPSLQVIKSNSHTLKISRQDEAEKADDFT